MSTPPRDRIIDFRRIPASKLVPNPDNPREHDDAQRTLLQDLLNDVGIVGTCIVRKLPAGKFQIIDGHLRTDLLKGGSVPCVVVDLDDSEADLVLATYDPVGTMARTNAAKVAEIRQRITTAAESVRKLLELTHSKATEQAIEAMAKVRAARVSAGNRNQYRTFQVVLNFDEEKRLQRVLSEIKAKYGVETTPLALSKLLDIWDGQSTESKARS